MQFFNTIITKIDFLIYDLVRCPYTYVALTILFGILIGYLMHRRQLSYYGRTMPHIYNKLSFNHNEILCEFEGYAKEIIMSGTSSILSYGYEKVMHPIKIEVYENFAVASAFGYASILNEKADNYVIVGKKLQLSNKNSPYIINIEFDKEDLAGGKWEMFKKAISCSDDSEIKE